MGSQVLSPRDFHRQRFETRQREREDFRQQWLARTRAAVQRLAPEHPAVQAVYAFGSLVYPGRFDRLSDLDLAVDCDDIKAESRFWRALEEALERNVDLRPRAGTIARAVSREGELLYERPSSAARGHG